jgi:hemerythrin
MAGRRPRPLLRKSHALGHEAIDLDHRAMADCWAAAVSCERLQFEFLLARLKRLMRDHFDREAALMAQAGGRLCDCHCREHRMLLDLCERAGTLAPDNWCKAQSLLRNELPRLVREHIISMDQLAVLFLNTGGAKAGARGPQTG